MTRSFETPEFAAALGELLRWRRDVRGFRPDPLDEADIRALLEAAQLAPSVGLSQPWRFVRVRSQPVRAAVRGSFERCNAEALAGYDGEQAALYAGLKLSGLDDAPLQIAVFCVDDAVTGHGLGRRTMPETAAYSVVTAVHTLWLAARAKGIGMGWVSILDPDEIAAALSVPAGWRLIAYLCLGRPSADHDSPELERAGWERRLPLEAVLVER
jgi:5,6-dimethylbenzimidazole synthase